MTEPLRTHPLFSGVVKDLETLSSLYKSPTEAVTNKKTGSIDPLTGAFLESCPFFLIATADEDGRCSVSPRGGRPGFVQVLDEEHFAFPDAAGNNLTESLANITVNPKVGFLFVMPGRNDTLRVDGSAWVVIDDDLLNRLSGPGDKNPKTAVVVRMRSAYTHCARSFKRGRVWEPEAWAALDPPSMGDLYRLHLDSQDPLEEAREVHDGSAVAES